MGDITRHPAFLNRNFPDYNFLLIRFGLAQPADKEEPLRGVISRSKAPYFFGN